METGGRQLAELQPQHEFFVGADSDGCAFDSMEIKHKECFCPATIKYWNLQPISKFARQAHEFVNLYSKWRGANRFPALVMVFDLLREHPEVIARDVSIPTAPRLREFIASGKPLSHPGLQAYSADHPAPELDNALAWSNAVNAAVADIVRGVPPFLFARASFEKLVSVADLVVVSQTPTATLTREWQEYDLVKFTRAIAGQEMGTKQQHLAFATHGKYAPDHILMIGDAPGDLEAAQANNALFFPINPGREDESWRQFYGEGLKRFCDGSFKGKYEAELIRDFEKGLPATPPWNR